MKIVYLILAHNLPEQLRKLISALEDERALFVVHIDSRSSLDDFQSLFVGRSEIYFIEKRSPTEWGSYAIIEAILDGIDYIVHNLPDSERVVLLSGRDYPIKSSSHIISFFSSNPEAIYIEYFGPANSRWPEDGISRFPNFEIVSNSIDIFGGSLWWSFPTTVATFILGFLEYNPDFLDYFKTVTIPYESFFQTLLHNCGEDFIIDNLVNNNLSFVKWDVPYLYTRILGKKDLVDLQKSKCLFARKFDVEKQADLLGLIDKKLLGKSTSLINTSELSSDHKTLPKTQILLYLTNKNVKSSLKEYKKLQKAMAKIFSETRILFHYNGEVLQKDIQLENPFVFDNSILHTLNYKPIHSKLVPGSNHFPLLKYYLHNDQYDYYWFIEDDVRYNACWSHYFTFFTENNVHSDFIACNIKEYESEPNWYWWNTLSHPSYVIENQSKIRSFNPIFRISNGALKFIHESLLNGWSGHHEVLIPTLLKENGFIVNDFGGDGHYVLPGCLNRFYKPGSPDIFGGLINGSMRFRPFIRKEEMNQNLLYHPVKIEDVKDNDWQKLHGDYPVSNMIRTRGFSVIMPTYNQSHYIRRAILSLFNQTHEDWELIIINDGSTDNTELFIADFLNHKQISYIKNSINRGLGFALNQGLEMAKNNYIAYLPSDDYYHDNHLASLSKAFNYAEDPIFVYTRAKSEIIDSFGDQHIENVQTDGIFHDLGIQLVQSAHKRTTDRWIIREVLVTANLADMFWHSISSKGTFYYVSEVTCNWNIHAFQRHRLINQAYGGGLHKYKHFYGVESPLRMSLGSGKLVDEIEQYKHFRTSHHPKPEGLKILLVGELSYNHDRIYAFEEQGHQLHGLWEGNVASWTNTGPLPFGNVINIPYDNWRLKVEEIKPDVIYAQLNHGAINLAHEVLKSELDIPFVWHFKEGPSVCMRNGYWDKLVNLYHQSEGKIFINPEAKAWYSQFIPFRNDDLTYILDGDLAKAEYFTKEFTPKLSEIDGSIHTVAVGRMIGISLEMIQELASSNIHIHVYPGNGTAFNNEAIKIAPNHFHQHSFCQAKDWTKELSKYDAGWLHCIPSQNNGSLLTAGWDDLNLPCRISTYAAAVLPMIQLKNEGHIVAARNYLQSKHVGVFFDSCSDLIQQLHDKKLMARLTENMQKIRMTFSFDHNVDGLINFFKQVIQKKKGGGRL